MASPASRVAKEDYASIISRVQDFATRSDRAATKDEALKCAIQAAELCLQAVKAAANKADQTAMRKKAGELLDRAAQLKAVSDRQYTPKILSSATISASVRTKGLIQGSTEPQSARKLTKTEQIVLMRGSKLNGSKFAPWTAAPSPGEFEDESDEPFTDSDVLALSRQQMELCDGWDRAEDALPPPAWLSEDDEQPELTMEPSLPMDLVQDATTDCSVVASFCAGAARMEKGFPNLLSENIFPRDKQEVAPLISPNGKYIVKLNFNGCYRRVVIDDRLPTTKNKRVLHVVDRKNPTLVWPALLEKAYLKVRGGYDFPGSNSNTDLWILRGWIPEQVFLQDADTDVARVWERMMSGWAEGDVLVTMGTGAMSPKSERELGLAAQHDYAVLDVKEESGYQLVLMKNPWIDGKSWTGKVNLQPSKETSETDRLAESLAKHSIFKDHAQETLPPGTFWIPWSDVQQHFESIYLNWNPHLFSFREDIHFSWDLREQRSAAGSFANNPQFGISSKSAGTLWLLLCRHFQDATSAFEGEATNVNMNTNGAMLGHMSLYVYDRNGERISITESHLTRGPYVDAPQTLLRLQMPAATTYTAVVSEQNLPDIKQGFSFTAFSTMPIELAQARDRFPYSAVIESAWTSSSAGGSGDSLVYFTNPQFVLQIPQKSDLTILLETLAEEVSVNLQLAHSNGQRVDALASRDVIVNSGNYRGGSAFAQVKALDAGSYTVICSTFEANQRAAFTLRVDASTAPALRQLPSKAAGRISRPLDTIGFKPPFNRAACQLLPRRHTKFSAAVLNQPSLSAQAEPRSPVRIAIELHRGGLDRRNLAVSCGGTFADCRTSSVALPEVDVYPELVMAGMQELWLVVERIGGTGEGGAEEGFGVVVTTDGRVEERVSFGEWRVMEE